MNPMDINWRLVIERALLGLVLLLVLSSSTLVIYITALAPDDFFPTAKNWERFSLLVSSLAAIINFALTTGIIYVYIRQSRTLKNEVNVLRKQQELMEVDRQPEIDTPYNVRFFGEQSTEGDTQQSTTISLEDIGWVPDNLQINASVRTGKDEVKITTGKETVGFDNREPQSNSVRFALANSGGGIAKNFQLWIKAYVHDSGRYEGGWARVPLRRLDRYSLYAFSDNTIQPSEQGIEFEGEIKFKIMERAEDGTPIEAHTYEFSEGIDYLIDNGINDFSLTLELRYEDIFEVEYKKQFYYHRTNIQNEMDLKEFIASESPTIRYINTGEQSSSLRDKLWEKLLSIIKMHE